MILKRQSVGGALLGMEFWFPGTFPPKNNSQKVHAGDGNPASTAPLPEHSSSPQPHQGPVRATHRINSHQFCNCSTIHINLLIIFGEKKADTALEKTHPPVKAVHPPVKVVRALPRSSEEPSLLEVQHPNTV